MITNGLKSLKMYSNHVSSWYHVEHHQIASPTRWIEPQCHWFQWTTWSTLLEDLFFFLISVFLLLLQLWSQLATVADILSFVATNDRWQSRRKASVSTSLIHRCTTTYCTCTSVAEVIQYQRRSLPIHSLIIDHRLITSSF